MPDNKVDGTDASENLAPGVTDAQGDQIGAGNDLVYGNGGADTITGGGGDDTLFGGLGRDYIYGGTGNDYLDGGADYDFFYGGSGNDTILISPIGESAFGEADADTFIVVPDAIGFIPGGSLHVNGDSTGIDMDTLDLSQMAADGWTITSTTQATDGQDSPFVAGNGGFNGTFTLTKAGFQSFIVNYVDIESFKLTAPGPVDGTAGSDRMDPGYTDAQGDEIDGSDGLNDTILAAAGDDVVDAGLGDDTVKGGIGNDVLQGNVGNDALEGEGGADSLVGGEGTDSLIGGDGSDTLVGGLGADTLAGGAGDDDIALSGADVVSGGSGDDVFALDPTDSAPDIAATVDGGTDATAGAPDDAANGNAGDVLDLSSATAPLTVVLGANPESGTVNGLDADAGTDITFAEIERLLTGSGNDTLAGGAATGPIWADTGAGNDSLTGGAGNDTLAGGDGADTLAGGAGNDSLIGGGQDDIFVLAPGFGTDIVLGGETGETVGDTLDARPLTEGVAVTLTGPEAGTLTGPSGTVAFAEIESILLGAGNDTVTGGSGNDSVDGGAGNDSLTGGAGNDTLAGGDGADTLAGGAGNDSLIGGAGDDDFTLGAGDSALGGAGDDEFRIDPSLTGTAGITVVGGETAEEAVIDPTNNPAGRIGDVLDLRGLTGVVVTYTNPDPITGTSEAGTATYLNASGQPVTITFSQIETVLLDRDGIVDGTAGGDLMTPTSGPGGLPYADAQGDQIDGTDGIADSVLGGAGNDTIDAGLGDDTIDAGSGDDSVAGGTGNDRLLGNDGNDTLAGGDGADSLAGGANDDSLTGGIGGDTLEGDLGEDTLRGEDGADTLTGNAGNDSLDGGAGDDSVIGGDGRDTVDAGEGDDFINTRATAARPDAGFPGFGPVPAIPTDTDPTDDRDVVTAGAGNDTILTGDDADLIDAGSGDDTVDAGVDNDTVLGGDGADTITGGEGRDSLDGGVGDDVIDGGDPTLPQADIADTLGDPLTGNNADTLSGGDGDDTLRGGDDGDILLGGADRDLLDGGVDHDTLDGGTGADSLIGGQGNDSLVGGAGDDTLDGGDGRDTLVGGTGTDRLNGGLGADVFVADGSTPDVITDFDAVTGISTGQSGAAQDDNDFVSLASFYNAASLAAWNAANPGQRFDSALDFLRADQADGILQQAGGLVVQSGGAAVAAALLNTENTGVVCFTRGTRILTADGERPIETLSSGDLVLTLDHGYQPIRWIGSTTVAAEGKCAPIRIEAGVLGNHSPLRVSPQHRMLLAGWEAELLYDAAEVLVAAKMLVNDQTIRRDEGGMVEYFHMLFDGHEVIYAEGAASESFHPGQVGWGALAEEARAEILSLFPLLATGGLEAYGPSARRGLTAMEATVAAEFLLRPCPAAAAE